jgi:predicted nuclease of predicted toxin-antitoxin system
MKLLLDQGLPRSTVSYLMKQKIPCTHVAEVGLADASDAAILDYAREKGRVVVTLDADFHTLLALAGATFPSVIRIRIEGLRAEILAKLLTSVLEICERDLAQGALVSVTETAVRIRHLPLLR